jgi:hypothetical protein
MCTTKTIRPPHMCSICQMSHNITTKQKQKPSNIIYSGQVPTAGVYQLPHTRTKNIAIRTSFSQQMQEDAGRRKRKMIRDPRRIRRPRGQGKIRRSRTMIIEGAAGMVVARWSMGGWDWR